MPVRWLPQAQATPTLTHASPALNLGRPCTLPAGFARISHDDIKTGRAGFRGCLCTQTPLGEQMTLNRFI